MSKRKTTLCLFLFCTLFFWIARGNLAAQITSATLTGAVDDTTGAAIPGALVTVVNQRTGFKTSVKTSAAGQYTITQLTPGAYQISASESGFKTVEEHGFQLITGEQARMNFKLPIGEASQTVTVSGQSAQLNFVTPTLSGGMTPQALQHIPLIISGAPRSSATVAILIPGVTAGASGNAANVRMNGGLVSGDEALVDGASAAEGYMNQSGMVSLETDFGMSPDITSEVRVLTANYGPEYGNSTSGQIIVQTRAGSAQFHGSVYEYLTNRALNAFQYGTPSGTAKPENTENDYGARLGGPLVIPGLVGDQRYVKGYFFFSWEAFKEAGGANSATLSIPTLAERQGDFSALGSQLYYPNDPSRFGSDAGKPIAYNGQENHMNPAYEDAVAKAWMAQLPTPTNNNIIDNYFIPKAGQGSLTASENVYFGRVDFLVGNNDHLFFDTWQQWSGVNSESDLPINISTATPASPENANIERLNWQHNFTGAINNNFVLGYLNRNEGYFALNGKADLPKVPGVADPTYLPQFDFSGGYTQLGSNNPANSSQSKTTRGTWVINDVFTDVAGSHTISGGFQYRLAGTSIHKGGNQGGTFNFSADTTGNAACNGNTLCPGDPIASFYLGAASNANVQYYNVHAEYPRQTEWSFFAGDNWRMTRSLTFDYGLRWDYISPFREKYNNLSFFDPQGLNPGAINSAGQELRGSLAFAGNKWGAASYGSPYPEVPFKKGFAPRLGLAYAISQKAVIRAGYGIYFGQAFYPGWSGGMGQDGFNKDLTLSETTSNGFEIPALYLESGIPAGQVGQTENISGSADNGQTPSLYRPLDGNHRPYSQQWNVTVQQQLPRHFVATLSYVGTKGTHLPSLLSPLNVINPNDPRIQAIGENLAVSYNSPGGPQIFQKYGVSVPYAGWANQMTGCAPTIAQALLPYPQYCGNLQGLNEAHATSIYNSVQAELQHRFDNGLFLMASLTLSKLYTDGTFSTQSGNQEGTGNDNAFSPYNEKVRSWSLAPDNVPSVFQLTSIYDLPLGLHKRYLNSGGALNILAGGWQVSPLFRYSHGIPLTLTSSSCPTSSLVPEFRESCVPGIIPGQSPYLNGIHSFNPHNNNGRYLNAMAFENNFSSFGYTGYGKAVSTVYGPGYKDTDIALIKNIELGKGIKFQLVTNFFNAFNNHYYVSQGGAPSSAPSSAFVTDVSAPGNSFGTWDGTVSNPRRIQMAARIEF